MTLRITHPPTPLDPDMAAKSDGQLRTLAASGASGKAKAAQAEIRRRTHQQLERAR